MPVGIFIAVAAVLFELILAYLIYKQFLTSRNSIPTAQEFQALLESSISQENPETHDNSMILELHDLMGGQRSPTEVKSVITNHLSFNNDKIRYLANLGPAVGLFFTFCGMFLMVLNIANKSALVNEGILNQAFYNLYPVFLGGAFGIAVYGFGMILLSKLEILQFTTGNELFKTFLFFERENDISKPKSIEDAYLRILKPLTDLILKLKSMNKSFQDFSDEANNLVVKYAEKTTNFIEKIDNTNSDFFIKLRSNFEILENITKNISSWNSLFIESAKQWKDSAASLSHFSESLNSIEGRLDKIILFSQNVIDLTKSLDINSGNINKLVNWVEEDRHEFSSLKDEIKKFVDGLPSFINTVEQFKLGLSPLEEKFNEGFIKVNQSLNNLPTLLSESQDNIAKQMVEFNNILDKISKSEVNLNFSDLMRNLPALLSESQKDLAKYLKDINTTLDKISKDGQSLYRQKDLIQSKNHKKNIGRSNFINRLFKNLFNNEKSK